MPPNGFNTVSVNDATIDRLDDIQAAIPDCDSYADAIERAVEAFDVEGSG